MKEDVLEQVVDDYLMHKGYYTRHNVRFKPASDHADFSKQADSVGSDIDVIALHPTRTDASRVLVVSCKAWQAGFDPAAKIREINEGKRSSGREAWKGFRELCRPKWSEAFRNAIQSSTGDARFTYCTVVTKLLNPSAKTLWENNAAFRDALGGNPIRIITLTEMLNDLWEVLTTTPAASDIGRAIQLMKAADWRPPSIAISGNSKRGRSTGNRLDSGY